MKATTNKQIKLIAIDLDGTFFNSEHKTSPVTEQTLKETLSAGIQVIFSSGRNHIYMKTLMDEIGVDLPHISSGGALLVDSKDGDTLYYREVSLNGHIENIVSWAKSNNTGLIGEYLDGSQVWFASNDFIEGLAPGIREYYQNCTQSLDPVNDYANPFLKMSMNQLGERVYDAAEMKAMFPGLHFVYSGYNCVDMTCVGVNKGNALKFYANHVGLDLSQIAAIGDQTNDIPMLEIVGLPIAMGNAPDEVKSFAEWIAPTNDENGAAWAMKKIIAFNQK
ncbi:MAG: HAD family phosphatase [Anaerolineaceae bacterium]|nr:HAD family phosphatase [Anaerolineaceae bacterium]